METGHPSTRAVNSGSGNRALHCVISVCDVSGIGSSLSYSNIAHCVAGTLSVQAFGISEEEIIKYVGNGIICWGDMVTSVLEDVELRIKQTKSSETTSLVTVLLEGRLMS